MKTSLVLSVLALTVAWHAAAQVQPAVAPGGRHVEGELMVKFRGGPRGPVAERARQALRHSVKRHFDFIGWQQIRLPAGTTVEEGLAQYRSLPDVLAVEPNGVMRALDPGALGPAKAPGASSGTTGVGDSMFSQQWALQRIGAPAAWAVANGSTNVVVAVLDSGINYNHEDLRDNMWRNPGEVPGNGLDDDGNGFVDDVYGIDTADDGAGNDSDPNDEGVQFGNVFRSFHGTACAGIIGAMAGNGKGIAGVRGSVRLMALRGIKTDNGISNADAIQALDYAVLMKRRGVNLRVISMSFGGGSFSQAQKDAHDRVAREGILQVNGVHNEALDLDVNPRYPASYTTSNCVTVAASEGFDGLASFSSYGRMTVDLAAPGVAIVTTHGPATNDYIPDFAGTSAACPHVAGAAALLAAIFPDLIARQLQVALLDSVDVLPAFTNRTVTGGRLNMARALYRCSVTRRRRS